MAAAATASTASREAKRAPVVIGTAHPAATRTRTDCLARLHYAASWGASLPAAFPLYPQAKLVEAAGNDDAGCNARAVTFTVAAPAETMIEWYRARAIKAGFDAQVQRSGRDRILAGSGAGDSAYFLTFAARSGGTTQVDLIVNGAR